MKIIQTFHGPVGNVYNIEGDLILSGQSGAADMVRELARLREAIANSDATEETKATATAQISAAEAAAHEPKPDGATIQSYLGKAAAAIDGAESVATKAGKLAKTLASIGLWAAAFFT